MVEHLAVNEVVPGSSPGDGASFDVIRGVPDSYCVLYDRQFAGLSWRTTGNQLQYPYQPCHVHRESRT